MKFKLFTIILVSIALSVLAMTYLFWSSPNENQKIRRDLVWFREFLEDHKSSKKELKLGSDELVSQLTIEIDSLIIKLNERDYYASYKRDSLLIVLKKLRLSFYSLKYDNTDKVFFSDSIGLKSNQLIIDFADKELKEFVDTASQEQLLNRLKLLKLHLKNTQLPKETKE